MTKKTIEVCDRCNKIIASNKCEICDKDICEVCQNDISIGINDGEGKGVGDLNNIIHIICCKNCAYGLVNTKLKNYFDEDAHKDIRHKTIEIFKNALVMNTLEDKKQKEMINKSWTPKKAIKKLLSQRNNRYTPTAELLKAKLMKGGNN